MCLGMNPDILQPGERCARRAIVISKAAKAAAAGRIWCPPQWPPPPR